MTQSEAKQLLSDPTFAAWANGAKVQIGEFNSWVDAKPDADISYHDFITAEVRIKPEPKLRAWKPEEVPVGAMLRWKNVPSNRVLITGVDDEFIYGAYTYELNKAPFEEVLKKYEGSLDGGKTWLPCGVMEDAQ